jgi:hypothetical protein
VKHDWVVHAKPPFGGPAQVLKYLARYTHRIAISNRRLVSVDDRTVSFNWKDYARHNRPPRTMTLDGREFLRRFLLHAVPRGFMRIRHFGLWANRVRAKNLATCRGLLTVEQEASAPAAVAFIVGGEPPCCPACGRGRLIAGPHLADGASASRVTTGQFLMPVTRLLILAAARSTAHRPRRSSSAPGATARAAEAPRVDPINLRRTLHAGSPSRSCHAGHRGLATPTRHASIQSP